ncbi:hypothetical protein ABKN59_004336 [Abortiporus biennis]
MKGDSTSSSIVESGNVSGSLCFTSGARCLQPSVARPRRILGGEKRSPHFQGHFVIVGRRHCTNFRPQREALTKLNAEFSPALQIQPSPLLLKQ